MICACAAHARRPYGRYASYGDRSPIRHIFTKHSSWCRVITGLFIALLLFNRVRISIVNESASAYNYADTDRRYRLCGLERERQVNGDFCRHTHARTHTLSFKGVLNWNTLAGCDKNNAHNCIVRENLHRHIASRSAEGGELLFDAVLFNQSMKSTQRV